jgi:hypothetical protein
VAPSEAPLSEILLDALGPNDQVAARAVDGETAMVLIRTPVMVLVQMRAVDGSALTAAVGLPGADYTPPEGAELDERKEGLIRGWLEAEHSPWEVLAEKLGDY